MRIAIHQSNFIPWYPFFYKMAMADKFILLEHVQFEKNGYQNRFKYKDKWITKPVWKGRDFICDKDYVGLERRKYWGMDRSMSHVNGLWIRAIKETLNISTLLTSDYLSVNAIGKTDRLIQIIKQHRGTKYITNPEAKDKYLDEDLMKQAGIGVEYCVVPKNLRKSTFEVIEELGIEGAIKNLPKKVNHEVLEAVL